MIIKNTVNSLSKSLNFFQHYVYLINILFSKKYFKSIFNIIKRKINFFLFSKYFYINNLLFKEIKL